MSGRGGGEGSDRGTGLRARLAEALAAAPAPRVPDDACELRAAVALVLRPDRAAGDPAPGAATAGDRMAGAQAEGATPGPAVTLPPELVSLRALFVRRARLDRDPWSGHVALPGGRAAAADADLLATALRELREETALALDGGAVLGRLGDLHPRSRHLPSIAVTPFVLWDGGGGPVRPNHEVEEHRWIRLATLVEPGRRSRLVLEREAERRVFPTLEVDGFTIWGLTHAIVADFLRAVGAAELETAREGEA